MSRFQSLLVGSLVIGQIVMPSVAFAASGSTYKYTKTTNFSLPGNFFFSATPKPVVTPSPTPSATAQSAPTKYILPVIVSFKPIATPSVVASPLKPTLQPSIVPSSSVSAIPTKASIKQSILPQDKKDTIKVYFNSMQKKLNNLIEKLSNLSARMDTKVAELKAKGISTEAIEKVLNAAKMKIAEAKTDLADAATKIEELLTSSDRKAAFDSLKKVVLAVQGNLKVAHELLTDSANQLKKAYQSITSASANQ